MALQRFVKKTMPIGIIGEFSDTSETIVRAYATFGINGHGAEFGKMCSFLNSAVAGTTLETTYAKQGVADEDALVMGVLVNPKEHYQIGFDTNKVPQIALAKDGIAASVATKGHIWVKACDGIVAGGKVFVETDGTLVSETAKTEGAFELTGATWIRNSAADTVTTWTDNMELKQGDFVKKDNVVYIALVNVKGSDKGTWANANKFLQAVGPAVAEVAINDPKIVVPAADEGTL